MMVQNIIEPFNVDIIKVTIKDKPIAHEYKSAESVKIIFEALRLYAQQEKKIREVKTRIGERTLKRKVRSCFKSWYNYLKRVQKKSENTTIESKLSNERKIELFVNAIAEKQKQIECVPKNEKCQKRSSKSKSAPQQSNEAQVIKPRRSVSGATKTKGFLETPAQSRLEAQRLIIEEQKAKLAEQNKLLDEIKLNEINKEVKQTSIQTIIAAKQVLNQCDEKTKRSIIHLIKEQGHRDKSIIDISEIPCSPLEFVMRMEARAEARKEKLKQINEIRQRKREEEKKKLEISRQQAEEKERQEQIQAMKEAMRIRKEQEERRLKELERNRKQELLAEQFHKKYLFHKYIVKPLISLVHETNKRFEWANQHYEARLLLRVFFAWKRGWIEQQNAKLVLAKKIYQHNLLWYIFDDWRTVVLDVKYKYQVALDFYDMKIQAKCIKSWHVYYDKIKNIDQEKEVKAIERYEKHLKMVYFNLWKKFRLLADDIKDMEKRREEWRKIIKKIAESSKWKNVSLNFKTYS